jgi:GntR family transcriptional repressor for pyruvate dehydrogenase complex
MVKGSPRNGRSALHEAGLAQVDDGVLSVILDASGPVGARMAAQELQDRGHKVSEATVSRIFARLDELGLTVPVGAKGRVLTGSGRRYIERRIDRDRRARQFDRAFDLRTVEEIVEWLTARQLLESQAAKLAADRATPEQLAGLERSVEELQDKMSAGEDPTPVGLSFHELLADAAASPIFMALISSLYSPSLVQVERALDVILRSRGSMADSVADHRRVMNALRKRDAPAAGRAMSQHLGRLLREVARFEDQAAAGGPGLQETLRLIQAARFPL